MSSELIASVSGVRGIVGGSLTPDVVLHLAQAFGTYLEGQPAVVSRDSRPSGEMLRDLIAAGLMSAGCGIHHLSIAPTPTVGLAIRQLEAAGGVQITASHNPSPYNGLKLFGRDGTVIAPAEGEKVLRIMRERSFRRAGWDQVGLSCYTRTNPLQHHMGRVLELVDTKPIQKRRFRVLVDANHGAGGPLAQLVLVALQCQVHMEGGEPSGLFAHEPEPTEANLKTIAPLVREHGCDLGLALDPDADRLALIDETGRYIGEELTLALAAEFRLAEARGPVVVNMSTSRVVEDIARRHGCEFLRAPVGEANVGLRMRQTGAVLGGEGNGGVMDPRVGLVRDPYAGMVMVLALMAQTGQRLSQLADALPRYVIQKDKYPLDRAALPQLYQQLRARWPEARVNEEDGLRLDWPSHWVHVRPSNTEPIVRVIAEAPEAGQAQELCREVGRCLPTPAPG